jgi:hypothetical protein
VAAAALAASGRLAARRRVGATALAATAVALVAAGCGNATSPGSSSAASGSNSYFSCLSQHGVKLPTSRPSRGTGGDGGGGGFGGGGFGGSGSSAFRKASQACASLRPSGGFGGGGGGGGSVGGFGGGFSAALSAFRSCMSSHGEPVPTTRPSSPPGGLAGIDRILNGLNPANSKVAAAVKACESKLPSFLRGGTGSAPGTGGSGGGASVA